VDQGLRTSIEKKIGALTNWQNKIAIGALCPAWLILIGCIIEFSLSF